MGVQHTFGGVSRVLFPVAAGVLMDHFGVGVPFWTSGLLVLATLPFAWALAGSLPAEARGGRRGAAGVIGRRNGEFPVQKVVEEEGYALRQENGAYWPWFFPVVSSHVNPRACTWLLDAWASANRSAAGWPVFSR